MTPDFPAGLPPLYPLKFNAIYKEKPWGGTALRTHLGRATPPLFRCGESWEISGLAPDVSVVANGAHAGKTLHALLDLYREALVGRAVYRRHGHAFPLLVKLIDAGDDLSVQAHPDDAQARARHHARGKTEMWYVLHAEPGATLAAGFRRQAGGGLDRDMCRERLRGGDLAGLLQREAAQAGDIFFLPAGRIHMLGKGILVAEIQQASDITYRLHDFNRVDAHGNLRPLHLDEGLAALDYSAGASCKTAYACAPNQAVTAVHCEHFTTDVLACSGTVVRDYTADSFVLQVCVQGAYTLDDGRHALHVAMGDCILLPASVRRVTLAAERGSRVLEVYISSE